MEQQSAGGQVLDTASTVVTVPLNRSPIVWNRKLQRENNYYKQLDDMRVRSTGLLQTRKKTNIKNFEDYMIFLLIVRAL
jgi:hypothetical protein